MGGTVLLAANAVVLAADCPLREGLRHELAHLFAFRWNTCASASGTGGGRRLVAGDNARPDGHNQGYRIGPPIRHGPLADA